MRGYQRLVTIWHLKITWYGSLGFCQGFLVGWEFLRHVLLLSDHLVFVHPDNSYLFVTVFFFRLYKQTLMHATYTTRFHSSQSEFSLLLSNTTVFVCLLVCFIE